MTEAEATQFFSRDEIDLVNDIVTARHLPSPGILSSNRSRLIALLRKVLVNRDCLKAYCRLLLNRKADNPEPNLPPNVAEHVLKNEFDQLSDDELLQLTVELDGLSVLHEILHEESSGAWLEEFVKDGVASIRSSGFQFRSAEDMLHDAGVPATNDSYWVDELEIVPPYESIGIRDNAPKNASEATSPVEAPLWTIRNPLSSTRIALPTAIALRCYATVKQNVALVFKIVARDTRRGILTIQGMADPAPTRGDFTLILHLPNDQEVALCFTRSANESGHSNESNNLDINTFPNRIIPVRLEFR